MDEDLIQAMRAKIATSMGPAGLTLEEAGKTTRYSQELLNQYHPAGGGNSEMAAFQLEAFVTAPANQPVAPTILAGIADVLRERIKAGSRLNGSDLQIGLHLHSSGFFGPIDVESLVNLMKGVCDFTVVSAAHRLFPIIGTGFIQDYLESTALFETGGMGGPQKRLIREMANEAIRKLADHK